MKPGVPHPITLCLRYKKDKPRCFSNVKEIRHHRQQAYHSLSPLRACYHVFMLSCYYHVIMQVIVYCTSWSVQVAPTIRANWPLLSTQQSSQTSITREQWTWTLEQWTREHLNSEHVNSEREHVNSEHVNSEHVNSEQWTREQCWCVKMPCSSSFKHFLLYR